MIAVGVVVIVVGSGLIGVVTAIRRGVKAHDSIPCNDDGGTPLPDYIEIDGFVQVHPSKVREYKES